jgi:hypothetical protein
MKFTKINDSQDPMYHKLRETAYILKCWIKLCYVRENLSLLTIERSKELKHEVGKNNQHTRSNIEGPHATIPCEPNLCKNLPANVLLSEPHADTLECLGL